MAVGGAVAETTGDASDPPTNAAVAPVGVPSLPSSLDELIAKATDGKPADGAAVDAAPAADHTATTITADDATAEDNTADETATDSASAESKIEAASDATTVGQTLEQGETGVSEATAPQSDTAAASTTTDASPVSSVAGPSGGDATVAAEADTGASDATTAPNEAAEQTSPIDTKDLPVLPQTLMEPAPDGAVTAPKGLIPSSGPLPVLSDTLPEPAEGGSVEAPPGLIPSGPLKALPNTLPEPAPDGPIEVPRSDLDTPIPVTTETIRLGNRQAEESGRPAAVSSGDRAADGGGRAETADAARVDALTDVTAEHEAPATDASSGVGGIPDAATPAKPPIGTPADLADSDPSDRVTAHRLGTGEGADPAGKVAASAEFASPVPVDDVPPATGEASEDSLSAADALPASRATTAAERAHLHGAFEAVSEPVVPNLPVVSPQVLAALQNPAHETSFDPVPDPEPNQTNARPGFLPMPLAKPLNLPQQDGPGVVVASLPAGGGLNGTGVLSVSTADVGPHTVGLADFAFGAFQRGLYGTALTVALQAAARDDAAASALIGRIYEEGWGVGVDASKAAGWYAVAAELGDPDAKARLATLFLTGRGVPKSVEKAARVYEDAARGGSARAAYALAIMILEEKGRVRDLAEARRFMTLAAEGGIAEAQYALAVMFADGEGAVHDEEQATRWFGRAAGRGDASAMVEYAIRIYNGVGAPADEARAAAFFAEAARAGNVVAMNRLARIIATGRMENADEVEAVKWHLIARRAGLSDLFLDGYVGTRSPEVVAEAERRVIVFRGG